MKTGFSSLVFLLFAVHSTGCAFGNRIEYRGTADFSVPSTDLDVALGVQDLRPYVLNGDKSSSFVGLQRSLYGIPYGVHTKSGLALADDLGSFLTDTMKKKSARARVTQVRFAAQTAPPERVAALRAAKAARWIVVELREWKTDTYFGTTFHYDVTLSVLEQDGAVSATKNVHGIDKLGDRPERPDLPGAVNSIFGELLTDPAILAALSSPVLASKPAVDPKENLNTGSCNLEQIEQMRKTGIPENRIKAACQ